MMDSPADFQDFRETPMAKGCAYWQLDVHGTHGGVGSGGVGGGPRASASRGSQDVREP